MKRTEEEDEEGEVDGKLAWIRMTLIYLKLLRASELFAEDGGRVRAVFCLRGE